MWEDWTIKGMLGFRIIMLYNARMDFSKPTRLAPPSASARAAFLKRAPGPSA
jgi:hypothetical protein